MDMDDVTWVVPIGRSTYRRFLGKKSRRVFGLFRGMKKKRRENRTQFCDCCYDSIGAEAVVTKTPAAPQPFDFFGHQHFDQGTNLIRVRKRRGRRSQPWLHRSWIQGAKHFVNNGAGAA